MKNDCIEFSDDEGGIFKCFISKPVVLTLNNIKVHALPEDLPEWIEEINIINSCIEELPQTLPRKLRVLRCEGSALRKIHSLPDGLTVLTLGNTLVDSLPPLPDTLIFLEISGTQIKKIDTLPLHLGTFLCNNTSISELPEFPPGLHTLGCENTHIEYLNTLPSYIRSVDIANNSKLICLPELPDDIQPYRSIKNCPSLTFLQQNGETLDEYVNRWRSFYSEQRAMQRNRYIHEELISVAMSPERMMKFVEKYGIKMLRHF
jgi:hypothetical protein